MDVLRSINWMTLTDNSKNLPGYVILNKTGSPSYVFIYRTADKTASRVTKTMNIISFDLLLCLSHF